MIPKIIWTAWLGGEMPELVKKCIESQKIPGYEHHIITLDNCKRTYKYVNDAIAAKKWVKAVDFLRMQYLYEEGGIFLDADVEIMPGKNFDLLLNQKMFAARELNGFIGTAVLGAVPDYPFINEWMCKVLTDFRGDDDKNFESSMDILVRGYFEYEWPKDGFELVPRKVLYPYDHQTGKIEVVPGTITYHHFLKSWVQDYISDLVKPTVTFLIPTMDTRPEGLATCIESIKALDYPQDKIEIVVLGGEGTVPEKVAKGLHGAEGEWIVYAADDTEFTPTSLANAITFAQRGYPLVAFNTGPVSPDRGNEMEHFLIKRDYVPTLDGGEIFSTDFHHVGVDNWLREQAESRGNYTRCEEAVVIHRHFSKGGNWDDTYAKAWDNKRVEEDRATLKAKLESLWMKNNSNSTTPSNLSE